MERAETFDSMHSYLQGYIRTAVQHGFVLIHQQLGSLTLMAHDTCFLPAPINNVATGVKGSVGVGWGYLAVTARGLLSLHKAQGSRRSYTLVLSLQLSLTQIHIVWAAGGGGGQTRRYGNRFGGKIV